MESTNKNTGFGKASRNWFEIVYFILTYCKKPSLKTHIMYRCSLNSSQITRYIEYLKEHMLVKKNSPTGMKSYYETTALGYEYLEAYDKIRKILSFDSQEQD